MFCYNRDEVLNMIEKIEFLEKLLPDIRELILSKTINEVIIKDNEFDNIVTDLDILVQNTLIKSLTEAFDDTHVLGEESEEHTFSDKMWIIDPIDGTKNFFRRREDFAISIAYYEYEKPIFGFVYDVVKNDLYLGITGQGAYLNKVKIEQLPIRSMNQSVLDMNLKTLYTLQEKYNANVKLLSQQVFAHRNIGSAAISMCQIARGLHDIYISSHLKIWDFAASRIVLKEVGGQVYLPFEAIQELNVKSVFLFATSSRELYNDLNQILYGEKHAC